MAEVNELGFDDDRIELAAANYESQESLVAAIKSAFGMCEMSIVDLASELELDVPVAQAWIDGEVDLTLSELRHLANAVDAHVSYTVRGVRTRYRERFVEMTAAAVWEQTDDLWATKPTAPVHV